MREVGKRKKRAAGEGALKEGARRVFFWKAAELFASVFRFGGVELRAKKEIRDARRRWVAGGEAEREVGVALDGLCEHGFYVFHDVVLPGIGNVDHVALGPHGFFAIETKCHRGRASARGNTLLVNGRPPEKDFVSQAWRGSYRLKEMLGREVSPVLCFTRASAREGLRVKGVRVLEVGSLAGTILESGKIHEFKFVSRAVAALGASTGCHPSAVPCAPGSR